MEDTDHSVRHRLRHPAHDAKLFGGTEVAHDAILSLDARNGPAASLGKLATNAEWCSVRFVSHGTANHKCTALGNVGVMLLDLRRSGQADRANTKPTVNAEPQRRDRSGSIGWHPDVEKTVHIQPETKNLQTHKWPLSYLGTPGPGEPLSSNRLGVERDPEGHGKSQVWKKTRRMGD